MKNQINEVIKEDLNESIRSNTARNQSQNNLNESASKNSPPRKKSTDVQEIEIVVEPVAEIREV